MILSDFFRALGQLSDGRFQRVFWLGIGLALLLLIGVYAAFLTAMNWITPDEITLPFIGPVTWVGQLVSLASLGFMILLSIFLMVPVASVFTGLFLDDIADAVEARHYAHLEPKPRRNFWDGLVQSLNFLGVLVFANLMALVLYIFFTPFAPLIFWGLNGYLLAREYFQMVAERRLSRAEVKTLYRTHWLQIWIAGILMALPLSVPLLNLMIPILGVATFTHLFQRLNPAD